MFFVKENLINKMHILNAILIGLGLGMFLKKYKSHVSFFLTTLRLVVMTNGSIFRATQIVLHSMYYPFTTEVSETGLFLPVWINLAVIQIVYSLVVYGLFNGTGYMIHLIVTLVLGIANLGVPQLEYVNAMDIVVLVFILNRRYGKAFYQYVCLIQLTTMIVLERSYLWVVVLGFNILGYKRMQ